MGKWGDGAGPFEQWCMEGKPQKRDLRREFAAVRGVAGPLGTSGGIVGGLCPGTERICCRAERIQVA